MGLATPCGGCTHLRKHCYPGCLFASYFPPGDEDRFAAVHAVFDARNVANLLMEMEPEQRAGTVLKLIEQATVWQESPAYFPAREEDRLTMVNGVFGSRNVSKLLAEVDPDMPEERAAVFELLFLQAAACQADPGFGRLSFVFILRQIIRRYMVASDAARVEFMEHVGHATVFQPLDAAEIHGKQPLFSRAARFVFVLSIWGF